MQIHWGRRHLDKHKPHDIDDVSHVFQIGILKSQHFRSPTDLQWQVFCLLQAYWLTAKYSYGLIFVSCHTLFRTSRHNSHPTPPHPTTPPALPHNTPTLTQPHQHPISTPRVLHPQHTCHLRGCSYHTRALRHIRLLINLSRMVTRGLVTSRLDYCNGLCTELSLVNQRRGMTMTR